MLSPARFQHCGGERLCLLMVQEMQMLNKGPTTDDEEEATTAERSRHSTSTPAKHYWWAALNEARRWLLASKNIDWMSRILFPATFVVFNIIYWSVYLSPPYIHCNLVAPEIDYPCFNTSDPDLDLTENQNSNGSPP